MADHDLNDASTTDGLPLAPSLGVALESARIPRHSTLVDRRVIKISALAFLVGIIAALVAQGLMRLIGLITNLAFYGRLDSAFVSPAANHLGLIVVLVPVVGAIVIGFMARYGSQAIRGHGIPEAMEQILLNRSRIPARVTILKPLSAAISIGTGGPFGAEGPIIATGGALGSLFGQWVRVTANERRTLLAAGAAAGMAATFGSPLSAILLAIELLLFEFSTRSVVPVAIASGTAAIVRVAFMGTSPMFAMPSLAWPTLPALGAYIALGAVIGIAAVYITRAVYAVEDGFSRLPIHWMWWPAIGAIAVGVIGYWVPRTLGVGYENIIDVLSGALVGKALILLCIFKLISWVIALGSGTSGGTLAPLMTVGAGLGALLGKMLALVLPHLGVDPGMAALVGMAAIFAGASRALFMSIVFVIETTWQAAALLPLVIGCTAAYLVSSVLMQNTIMTEKIARRGVRVPVEYTADFLFQVLVRDYASYPAVTLKAGSTLAEVRAWLDSGGSGTGHQGFPLVDDAGKLCGIVTRKDLFAPGMAPGTRLHALIKRPPRVVYEEDAVGDAAEWMAQENIGRVPVVCRADPDHVLAMLTRSDIMAAYHHRSEQMYRVEG
ncbi:MAG: chloride channel protein [Chromatiales bacterium 21-64-14]|nr:MAG: chloride channel protein [Chromatiales bacterium 21-64-14]HQU15721.1 chloride channel protein [Gammaproteobacteria bacterium]